MNWSIFSLLSKPAQRIHVKVTDLDALKKNLNEKLKLGHQSVKNEDDIGAARMTISAKSA